MSNQDLSRLQSREYRYDLEKHWDKLLSGEQILDPKVRPVVLESWRRCKAEGIDPSKAVAPLVELDANGGPSVSEKRMRNIIQKSLKSVGHYLEETQSVLIGTDRQGQLFFVEGDDALSDNLAENAVTTGATWDEMEIGTNAIGTALKEQRQVLVHGHEHFCVAGKQWSCAADVIRDPSDHSILGVVDLTGPVEAIALRAPALITALVERIESELAKLDLADQLSLIDHYHDHSGFETGLLLVDRRGKVIRRNSWSDLDHAKLTQGGFVPGLQGLTPDQWSLDLAHESLRDGEMEWIHSDNELIGAAIHVGRKTKRKRTIEAPEPLRNFVEVSPSLSGIVDQAAILASSDVPVLVTGETGVGKEVLSSAIHQSSDRSDKPFVAVNCSAIPADLIGVELFGYVEGAFTGARRGGMPGRIEDAQGGTLFLDEIGDMPLETQPYLLRVLESGRLTRMGESRSRDINVRIIAATHRPLEELVESGAFRSDLFYRLNVARLHLPALRERPGDILPLANRLLDQISSEKKFSEIDEKFAHFLTHHDFQGNVRELKSIVQRYALGLPVIPFYPTSPQSDDLGALNRPLTLAEIEQRAIEEALERNSGSVDRAAAELSIPRSTLYRRISKMRSGISGGQD